MARPLRRSEQLGKRGEAQALGAPGKEPAGEHQRVDGRRGDPRSSRPAQLVVEEGEVETQVVTGEDCASREPDEPRDVAGSAREGRAEAVSLDDDGAELGDPAVPRSEARRLDVENDESRPRDRERAARSRSERNGVTPANDAGVGPHDLVHDRAGELRRGAGEREENGGCLIDRKLADIPEGPDEPVGGVESEHPAILDERTFVSGGVANTRAANAALAQRDRSPGR